MKNPTNLPIRLAQPAQRALAAAGITTLDQFTRWTEKEVAQWHGIGPNALKAIRQALAAHGLDFAS
ncbi:hypothetical protein ACFPMF_12830 [Larkinella bovis]|uniref:DNA-binding protein n=1 Tax=Larkinella bovis TaxID=683041 RepID=A0ABW0IDJ9_9BACT